MTEPAVPAQRWPIEQCASPDCRAPIIWAVTERAHRMPVDAQPTAQGSIALRDRGGPVPLAIVIPMIARYARHDLHTSHFATCTKSAHWRRPR